MKKIFLCNLFMGIGLALLMSLPACGSLSQFGAKPPATTPTDTLLTTIPTIQATLAQSPQKVVLGSLSPSTVPDSGQDTMPYTSSSLADLTESVWQTEPISETDTIATIPTQERQEPEPSTTATTTATATATATPTATPNPPTATPIPISTPVAAPDMPPGYIRNGSNIRYEPRVALETFLGQACPGDQIIILEQNGDWVRVYISKLAADCVPERVTVGTTGWVSIENVTILDYTPATLAQWQDVPEGLTSVMVDHVVNGDTIAVTNDDTEYRVRLIGADAPNTSAEQDGPAECFAREATAKTSELSGGHMVLLQADPSAGEETLSGDLLRYVWFPDGRMLNRDIIVQGYAFANPNETPHTYQTLFEQAETIARTEQRGLWSPDTCNGERATSYDVPIVREPLPQRPSSDVDTNGDGIVTCEDFLSQDDARRGLDAGYTELDTNNDGIPCEYLPPAMVPAPAPQLPPEPQPEPQPTITPLLPSPTASTSQPMWEIP